jgi:hypothetical protein
MIAFHQTHAERRRDDRIYRDDSSVMWDEAMPIYRDARYGSG